MSRASARIWLAVLAILAWGVLPAQAHHGWTSYNSERTLTLTGKVREAMFEHPHAMLRLDVEERNWLVILPPPTRGAGLGLTAATLRAGATVTVAGHPHRTVPNELRAMRITLNGKTLQLR